MADFMRQLRNDALKGIPLKSSRKRDEIQNELHLLWLQGGGTMTFIDDNGKEQKITLSFADKEEPKTEKPILHLNDLLFTVSALNLAKKILKERGQTNET